MVGEWKRRCGVCTMEYYSAIKKKILPKTWMDREVMVLSEVGETEKDKCCVTAHV